MTNQEILERAIKKAAKNGYAPAGGHMNGPDTVDWLLRVCRLEPEQIIFVHDFAKALWGEEVLSDKCKCGSPRRKSHSVLGTHGFVYENLGWQHHLQQMVIADDSIKYLGENI